MTVDLVSTHGQPVAVRASWLTKPIIVLPLILLLALALRLPNLTDSLWHDEVDYSTRYRTRDAAGLWRYLNSFPGAPLYPTLAFVWTGVAGESELAVRLPALAAGLGTVALTYALAGRFGGPPVAALAGVLIAASPAHVWYSHDATPYTTTMFFLLLAIVAWPSAATAAGRAWPIVYAVSLTAACVTHFYSAVFLGPLTLAAFAAPPRGRSRVLAGNAIAAVVALGVMAYKAAIGAVPTGLGFLRPFTPFEWWMFFFNWVLQGNSLWTVNPYRATLDYLVQEPLFLGVQVVAAVLIVRGLTARPAPAVGGRWELALYLTALPFTMWVLTLAGRDRMYIERYMLVVLPFFVVALARGALGWKSRRLRATMAGSMVALTAAAFVACTVKADQRTVYLQSADWRSAARYLGPRLAADPRARVVAGTFVNDFDFHLGRPRPRGERVVDRYYQQRFERWIERDAVDTIYLVNNVFWRNQFDRVFAVMTRHPRLRWTAFRTFRGVELYTFAVRRPLSGSTTRPAAVSATGGAGVRAP